MEQDRKPLLPENGDSVEPWRSHAPTGEEIGLASTHFNSETNNDRFNFYPPSLHGALVGSPDPLSLPFPQAPCPPPTNPNVGSQGGYAYQGGGCSNYKMNEPPSHVLDEVEVRRLLVDHVGHRCCWGSAPARTWQITSIENCFAYVGTLEAVRNIMTNISITTSNETFTEEREIAMEKEAYFGGEIDGTDKGPQPGIWELDLRADFPQLFIREKKVRIKIPHSEAVQKCDDCNGTGDTTCAFCHGMMQMTQCPGCSGSGLVEDQDGSDTICTMCRGKGMQDCASCNSRGTVTCMTCHGHGSLLTRNVAVIRWKTLYTNRVSTTSKTASVPDEVFHNARGMQLCNMQAYKCRPAFFADAKHLNDLSSQVIARRAPVPPAAQIIMERHIISYLPVTGVIMARQKCSFSFYIVGYNWDIYVKDYPSRFCWGLCCCFGWLNM